MLITIHVINDTHKWFELATLTHIIVHVFARPQRLDIRAFGCPNFVMGRRHWVLRYDLLVIMIYRQAKNPSVCLCAQRMFTAFST